MLCTYHKQLLRSHKLTSDLVFFFIFLHVAILLVICDITQKVGNANSIRRNWSKRLHHVVLTEALHTYVDVSIFHCTKTTFSNLHTSSDIIILPLQKRQQTTLCFARELVSKAKK